MLINLYIDNQFLLFYAYYIFKLKKVDTNLVSTQNNICKYWPKINKYKNIKIKLILKKYDIITAPTKVIIISMIA